MIIDVPGYKSMELKYLLLDYNGTIAKDGKIDEETKKKLIEISKHLDIFVLTADTYGSVREECKDLPLKVRTFPKGSAMDAKKAIAEKLGGDKCIALGNGRNDTLLLKECQLSICVLDEEGMYGKLLNYSDILVRSTLSGLDLILNPSRIIADLRG